MIELPEVRSARHEEAGRLAATLTLAFCSDPVARWAMVDANQFLSVLIALVGPFGGRAALDHGSAHVVGDFLGAAVWVPPGAHVDDEAIGDVFEKYVNQPRLGEIYATFEKMSEYHPREPHWYLPLDRGGSGLSATRPRLGVAEACA